MEYHYLRKYKEYEQHTNAELKFLDSIPDDKLLSFLIKGKNLSYIMSKIEKSLGHMYTEEDRIFNYLDIYDFEEYLNKRFPSIEIKHIVIEEKLIIN